MRGVEVKREASIAQIKEHKTWSGVYNKASPFCPATSFFSPSIRKLALRLTGSFAPPMSRFSRRALKLRRVFRLTVYLLRARVPQVIPPVGRRAEKARPVNSWILSAVFTALTAPPAEFI